MINREDFIKEKNRLLKKAIARTNRFNDNGKNYYWYRLNTLEQIEKKGLVLNGR